MVAGLVVVEATAPGHRPFRRAVQVAAGHPESVDVRLEATPLVAAPMAPVVAAPADPTARPVGPWIVAGAGAAGLVLGAVFYGFATGAQHDRDAATLSMNRPAAESFDRSYVGSLEAANVSWVLGAAALVGGATWFIVDRITRRDGRRAALRFELGATVRGPTLGLGATF